MPDPSHRRCTLAATLSLLVLALLPAAAGAATSATGEAQSCGISAGALTCWGAPTGGALGTGANLTRDSVNPLPVAGMGSGVHRRRAHRDGRRHEHHRLRDPQRRRALLGRQQLGPARGRHDDGP